MKRHTEAVQHSSKFPDWRTPPRLFAVLDAEFQFVVDAAADKTSSLCPHYFGPDHREPALRDGLSVNWAEYVETQYRVDGPLARTAIFLNPPYSRELRMLIGPWIKKAWEESQRGCTVVGVIPYSPQTEWWREFVEGHGQPSLATFQAAREARKIPHRVSFLRPDGSEADNAGGNTAIVVWRPTHGILAPWVPWSPYWEYL